jgi:hypothetical protein
MHEEANVAQSQAENGREMPLEGSVSTAVAPYIGQWNQLVSHTNWEKGRIIRDWRTALEDSGAASSEYSDETWSQLVGNVTPQHVGRLRRVHQRFHDCHEQFLGLYWSHFFAALDWDDAEMWLEGATRNGWSVSETRRMRRETLGAVATDDDEESDELGSEMDEDSPMEDHEEGLVASESSEMSRRRGSKKDGSTSEADEVTGETGPETWSGEASNGASEDTTDTAREAGVRPFADLPELPDDLSEAFESFKLAILSHKTTGWDDVAPDQVLASLDALKKLVVAP